MVIAIQIYFSQSSLITLIVSKKQKALESLFRFYSAGHVVFPSCTNAINSNSIQEAFTVPYNTEFTLPRLYLTLKTIYLLTTSVNSKY